MPRARKKADPLDTLIEGIYYRRCSGIQINILDISKVFAAGRAAAAAGGGPAEIEAAVVAFVETIRKN